MAIGSANYSGGNAGGAIDFSPIFQGMAVLGQRREAERVRATEELNKIVEPLIKEWGPQGFAKSGLPFVDDWAAANRVDLSSMERVPWNPQQKLNFLLSKGGLTGLTDGEQQELQQLQQEVGQTVSGGQGEQVTQGAQPNVAGGPSDTNPFGNLTIRQQQAGAPNAPSGGVATVGPPPRERPQAFGVTQGDAGGTPGVTYPANVNPAEAATTTYEATSQMYDRWLTQHTENTRGSREQYQSELYRIEQDLKQKLQSKEAAARSPEENQILQQLGALERSDIGESQKAEMRSRLSAQLSSMAESGAVLPQGPTGVPFRAPSATLELRIGGEETPQAVTTFFQKYLAEVPGSSDPVAKIDELLKSELGVEFDWASMRGEPTRLPDKEGTEEDESKQMYRLPTLNTEGARKFAGSLGQALGRVDADGRSTLSPLQAQMFRQTLIQRAGEGQLLAGDDSIRWVEEALNPRFVPGYGIMEQVGGVVSPSEQASEPGRDMTNAAEQFGDAVEQMTRGEAVRGRTQVIWDSPTERDLPDSDPPNHPEAGIPLTTPQARRGWTKLKGAVERLFTARAPGRPSIRERLTQRREEQVRQLRENGYTADTMQVERAEQQYVQRSLDMIESNPQRAAILFPESTKAAMTARQTAADTQRSEVAAAALRGEAAKFTPGTAEYEVRMRELQARFVEAGLKEEQARLAAQNIQTMAAVEKAKLELEGIMVQYKIENWDDLQAVAARDSQVKAWMDSQKITQDSWELLMNAMENLEGLSYEDAAQYSSGLNAFAQAMGLGVIVNVQQAGALWWKSADVTVEADPNAGPTTLQQLYDLGERTAPSTGSSVPDLDALIPQD